MIRKPKLQGRHSRFFKKLHDISIESIACYSETLESSSLSQGFELLLSPLFPTWVVSQHDHINMDYSLGGKAAVWGYRENAFSHDHFPVLW